jgi:hypothetical protein
MIINFSLTNSKAGIEFVLFNASTGKMLAILLFRLTIWPSSFSILEKISKTLAWG